MDVVLRDILVFLTSGNLWRHVLDLVDIVLVAFFLYRMFYGKTLDSRCDRSSTAADD